MGGRRKKGRKRQRRARPPSSALVRRGELLEARLEAVELARGHDGFLRGRPEPVLLVAGFGVGGGEAFLLSRALRRVVVREPFPSVTTITGPTDCEVVKARVPPECDRVVVLILAIEEDSGRDVEALYAELPSCELFSAWPLDERWPDPLGLEELARGPRTPPPRAQRVHLLSGGRDLREQCHADDWVGAALVVLERGGDAGVLWRYRFVSADGRNDWTALVRITF